MSAGGPLTIEALLPHQRPRARILTAGKGPGRWLAVMLRPQPPLDDALAALWYLEGSSACRARLPPIGGVELVINLGDPYELTGPLGPRGRFKTAWFEGLRDTWLDSVPCGASSLIGARFTATGAFRIVGPLIGRTGNQLCDAEAALGRDIPRLRDRIADQASVGCRLDVLEQFLRHKVRSGRAVDRRVAWAARAVADRRYANTVSRIGLELGMSHQRLVQVFNDHIGLTPKRFARVARFGRVVGSLVGATDVDWPEVALQHGYFDQSHLAREFQLLAGSAPAEFLRRRDSLSQTVVIRD